MQTESRRRPARSAGATWRGSTVSRSVIAAAVAGLVVLTGCGGTTEPSAPPTSEDALTTATSAPDVVEETTDAAPTTAAPEADDDGDMDQSEDGAEAFVQYYVKRLNAAYVSGSPEGLEALATSNCDSCTALSEGIPEGGLPSDYLQFRSASAELLDGNARVTTELEQLSGDGAGSGTLVFRLVPEQDGWLVDSITLVEK